MIYISSFSYIFIIVYSCSAYYGLYVGIYACGGHGSRSSGLFLDHAIK